jgi:acetoin utilization deacetylase AcuC-like enzyme
MAVAVFTHAACLQHDTGEGHPETTARLSTVLAKLRTLPEASVRESIAITDVAPLARVHPEAQLELLEAYANSGGGTVFLDTVISARSWDAVLGSGGAVLDAVRHAHEGEGHAFAAVRPPGHHALASKAMGFCLVNNVVVAARETQRLGRKRVLIVDWDVHHGNGTQALVERDASVRFVSLHQWPWYPGTGAADERGVGNIFNVPRPAGQPAMRYVDDLWAAVHQATEQWTPDAVLVSAGFDAMLDDPLGGFTLEPEHYAQLTQRLRHRLPDAPIVSLMEGGYDPARLADGIAAHITALV